MPWGVTICWGELEVLVTELDEHYISVFKSNGEGLQSLIMSLWEIRILLKSY